MSKPQYSFNDIKSDCDDAIDLKGIFSCTSMHIKGQKPRESAVK